MYLLVATIKVDFCRHTFDSNLDLKDTNCKLF